MVVFSFEFSHVLEKVFKRFFFPSEFNPAKQLFLPREDRVRPSSRFVGSALSLALLPDPVSEFLIGRRTWRDIRIPVLLSIHFEFSVKLHPCFARLLRLKVPSEAEFR
jgi:hypothetical protein